MVKKKQPANVSYDQILISRLAQHICKGQKHLRRNIAKYTGKHLCQSLFFNNRDSGAGIFL